MSVDQQFTALYEKLQTLLRHYNRLERENEKLREDLVEAQKKQALIQNRADELQQQMAVLKMAAGEMSDKDKKAFERRLNQYIKDIDRTIAYLGE